MKICRCSDECRNLRNHPTMWVNPSNSAPQFRVTLLDANLADKVSVCLVQTGSFRAPSAVIQS